MSSSQRTKLACASCTRRKVKCSKTVPCSNCIRREEQDTCAAEGATPGLLHSPPASVVDQREIDSLRSRILELEAGLQRRQSSVASSQHHIVEPSAAAADNNNNDNNRVNHDQPLMPANNEVCNSSDKVSQPLDSSDDAVLKDAASILEFLAWGRRKNADYSVDISLETGASPGVSSGDVCDARPVPVFPSFVADTSPITSLQLLLPGKKQIWELVRYHQECLLWYHCSFHGPTFCNQVEVFYHRFHGAVEARGLNLQWLALLFAVITGSITCAPDHKAQAWGFKPRERETLSRAWFRAVYTCLNTAEYAANQSILSVQAISTLTISAHLLGFSNIHSIHLAAAIRIAQALGLHRITTDETSGTVVDKECGRRLWSQLCCQDWFSIPFSDTYLINPLYSQSDPPMNCHDQDMLPLPESVPTVTTWCRLLTRIASIMPRLQDDLVSCNTPFTKYEQVIKWDKRMRALSTSERPLFLLNIPIDPSWPPYIPWARRSLAISSSHKIIMIHRSFLSESFTNSAFSFTRRTCLAASKTIIKEYKLAADEDEPILWISQAFSVAAAIILILDMLHRSPIESEYGEHKQLVEVAVGMLRQCRNSMIATRGVKLLSVLLEETSVSSRTYNPRKRRYDDPQPGGGQTTQLSWRHREFNVLAFVKSFCSGKAQSSATAPVTTRQVFADNRTTVEEMALSPPAAVLHPLMGGSLDLLSGRDSGDDGSYLPPGLETATPFENLLYLANHDFTYMGV